MDTEEFDVFLTLAEELHFGRTALRLRLPQPRVSRLVASLERRVGGTLFERTSRSVRLTPAGERLRDELRPAYEQMQTALSRASEAARQAAGVLTIGFTATSCCEALSRVTEAFERCNPGGQAVLREVDMFDPYTALRGGEIDVLFTWLAVDEPDLSAGPAIEFRTRVLLVAPGHPLAARESVSQEDLGDWDLIMCPATLPRTFYDTLIPARTPAGRPTRRAHPVHTINEIVTLVSLGRVVHPTCASVPMFQRDDVAPIPIRDMPPVAIGPMWCTAREDARILALVRAARDATLNPVTRS
jgi:DNA-binding transcriptional LysR family regulator